MTGFYTGKVLRTVGRSDFFPEGPPCVQSLPLGTPGVPTLLATTCSTVQPPFPASGEKEFGCWAPLPTSPSSLLSPAVTFGATRPRLLLKPEMHLHSL